MAGRVSIGTVEMDIQEAVSYLETQVREAREAVARPVVEQLNATFREVLENQGSNARPSFELVNTIPMFDGEKPQSLASFFQNLENVSELSQWTDEDRLRIARLRLSGAALAFVQTEGPDRLNTYENFKKIITERFSDKSPQHCFYQQLSVIQQRRGETIEAFADRVRALNEKTVRITANADVNAALREEADRRALDAFLRGLVGPVGEQTRLKFPTTMRDAITTAVAIEHLLRPSKVEMPERKVFRTDTETDVTCYRCHNRGHLSRDCQSRVPADSSSSPGLTCWRCGRKGHRRVHCRVKLPRQTNSPSSGNGSGASGLADTTPRQ